MKRFRCLPLLSIVVSACLSAGVSAADVPPATTLFQKPTVNATDIVFEYAGDLWRVARSGGDAIRLTAGPGAESGPVFSPDGKKIAFTGQYDGSTDVFVMPAEGGVPQRLTFHPGADTAVGWTPDGGVLFASSRASTGPYPRLFVARLEGGTPEALPLPSGERGAYSPDGSRIAYEPLAQWQPEWKRYHGGQTDKIWIARLSDSSVERIPRENSNDRYPMWIGNTVYFVSDREGTYSLFAYDVNSKQVTRLLDQGGMDIKSARAWGGNGSNHPAIVYEQFGTIHLYDVAEKKAEKVDIRVAADLLGVRPRLEKVADRIYSFGVSPTGVRAVFGARGDIVTVPAEKGDPRNITQTPGVNERDPAWSPDGKWIAYFSDESGEYALHVRDQLGREAARKFPLPPTFYYSPVWSPDSKKIAFTNKKLELWYLTMDEGSPVRVDKNPIGLRNEVLDPVWSPDSRWIGYIRQLDNRLRAVFLYSLEDGKSTQLTDGMSDTRHVAFDRGGKYLYFTGSTNLGPSFSFAEMSTFPFQSSRSVYAAVLRNDIPSPLSPESDEENGAKADEKEPTDKKKEPEAKAEDGSKAPAKSEGTEKSESEKTEGKGEVEPIRVDLEGIGQRILALPVPSLNYVGLQVGQEGEVYLLEVPPSGPRDSGGPEGLQLHKFDLKKRKVDKVTEGLTAFEISADGKSALYRKGQGPAQSWFIAALSALSDGGGGKGAHALKLSAISIGVDPVAEWNQMYREVWRGERDFFYDPNLHGLDLAATEKEYAPYLASVAHRNDLNYLFTEMLNQLTVGHMFIRGGDIPNPEFIPGGLLGCDYEVAEGRYRFAKIFNGENWNPGLTAPLTQPGVNVQAGEFLLAVDGREVRAADNVFSFFEGKADKQVLIRVGPNADGSDARDVLVVPVRSESGLRNRDWIEGNRRRVDELSQGRLAYVYVPNTSNAGYESFNRYFFSQTQKQGAVIDERFNQGGALADYIVEYLTRPILNMIYFREGGDIPTPLGAIYGPKAMIINEMAGSGGDALPWYFRKMKVGPLVGKRTWGGLVASFPAPQLLDGGFVTAPDAAIYGLDGHWEVENVGVPPDIEVEFDPAAWRQGRDPQLERAVQAVLEELDQNPPKHYERPAFPDYHD
ncbi:MAG: PDZ domain-containing protein [Acidobacteriota bacterium]